MLNYSQITPDIAELCGIITGDGHLSRYISDKRSDYRIEVSGNKTEEIEYFQYITKLFRKCFGKSLKLRIEHEYSRLYIHSKEILSYLEEIGMIIGKKSRIARFPKTIMADETLSLFFLKGLADTDFSVSFKKGSRKRHSYPRIVAEFASKKLVQDIQSVLERVDITFYKQTREKITNFGKFIHYRLEINGRNNLDKWLKIIGFSNPKHRSKIELWERIGYCPPYTTHNERIRKLMEK